MKTIEVLSKGQPVQFTTKSVTIAGKEYLYSHISELRHSEAKRVYGFKCDGDVVLLPYEEKDAQVVNAIFSRVRQLHRKPAPSPAKAGDAAAVAPAEKPAEETPVIEEPVVAEPSSEEPAPAEIPEAPVEAEEPAAEPITEETPIELFAEIVAGTEVTAEEAPAIEEIPAETADFTEDVPAETAVATEEAPVEDEVPAETTETAEEDLAVDEVPAEAPVLSNKERRKEEKRREKEQRKADKEAAKREKLAQKAAAKSGRDADVYMESADAQMDQLQKTARFKKAIIIFIIILAVFALLGVAYYFLIGPASDPQIGPNTTDQTQYNDIDDMINDLEN